MEIIENVFNEFTEEELDLVHDYFEINEKKKEIEKWLKSNKSNVETVLQKYGKSKMDFGDLRVNVVVPDASKFDNEKVVKFCLDNGFNTCLKYAVDEEALSDAIERNIIDVEALKEAAWVEAKGTPRLTVSRLKREE